MTETLTCSKPTQSNKRPKHLKTNKTIITTTTAALLGKVPKTPRGGGVKTNLENFGGGDGRHKKWGGVDELGEFWRGQNLFQKIGALRAKMPAGTLFLPFFRRNFGGGVDQLRKFWGGWRPTWKILGGWR